MSKQFQVLRKEAPVGGMFDSYGHARTYVQSVAPTRTRALPPGWSIVSASAVPVPKPAPSPVTTAQAAKAVRK